MRVARRYAQGAYGLAWKDLQRNGFVEHVQEAGEGEPTAAADRPCARAAARRRRSCRRRSIPSSRRAGSRSRTSRRNRSGHSVWEMYDGRGFELPGTPGGAPAYLAQHDFVHVIADYGTNLKGELEVFAFIGRADPDPKGFAWLATFTGLFETGYIPTTGFFDRDVRERVIQAPGMHQRIADAIRRGKVVCQSYGVDLFEVDYYDLARRDPSRRSARCSASHRRGPVRSRPVRSASSLSKACPRRSGGPWRNVEEAPREPELHSDDRRALRRPRADRRAARAMGLDQASTDIMGYMGIRLLADRENPGQYLIIADFGVVDPDVSAADEANRNNERPETQATAAPLRELVNGEPEYRHYDELYRTDF